MIFMLNFHEFLHTMYKYVLNSVVEISLMFDQYSEYYAIILGWGDVFSWTCCITNANIPTSHGQVHWLTKVQQYFQYNLGYSML